MEKLIRDGWVLTVTELKHERNLEPNAAHIYPEHKRANLGYQKQLTEAANFRSTGASYNQDILLILRPFTIHGG